MLGLLITTFDILLKAIYNFDNLKFLDGKISLK